MLWCSNPETLKIECRETQKWFINRDNLDYKKKYKFHSASLTHTICVTRSGSSTRGKSRAAVCVCINSCAPAGEATGACAALIAVHLAAHKLAFVIAELMNYWGAALAVAINLKVCTVWINNWACFVRRGMCWCDAKYSFCDAPRLSLAQLIGLAACQKCWWAKTQTPRRAPRGCTQLKPTINNPCEVPARKQSSDKWWTLLIRHNNNCSWLFRHANNSWLTAGAAKWTRTVHFV